MDAKKLESIQIGSHILAIYPTKEAKLNAAFQFLKAGLENNESVIIITDDMTKDDIRARMEKEWHVDVKKLEDKHIITIKNTAEWYYPRRRVEPFVISAKWTALAEISTMKCRKGLRVFGDVNGFFKTGRGTDLIRYESELEKEFAIPVTAVCAYERGDVENRMRKSDLEVLEQHHGHIWH